MPYMMEPLNTCRSHTAPRHYYHQSVWSQVQSYGYILTPVPPDHFHIRTPLARSRLMFFSVLRLQPFHKTQHLACHPILIIWLEAFLHVPFANDLLKVAFTTDNKALQYVQIDCLECCMMLYVHVHGIVEEKMTEHRKKQLYMKDNLWYICIHAPLFWRKDCT